MLRRMELKSNSGMYVVWWSCTCHRYGEKTIPIKMRLAG
jgi:hypothetical protein